VAAANTAALTVVRTGRHFSFTGEHWLPQLVENYHEKLPRRTSFFWMILWKLRWEIPITIPD